MLLLLNPEPAHSDTTQPHPRSHLTPSGAEGGQLTDLTEYVRNNAGKAFEFMLEVVEEDRKAQGLPDIATARAEAAEDPKVQTRLSAFGGLRKIPHSLLEKLDFSAIRRGAAIT